jgi:hypothetical protein
MRPGDIIHELTVSVVGLHRILSYYWLAQISLMKKSAKVQLYFGLDCGMSDFFTHEP